MIWRALKRADIHATKEPTNLLGDNGNRADDLTLLPWDVTIVDIQASSYTSTTSVTPYEVAEETALPKRAKYARIIQLHIFIPIAIETLGPISMDFQRFFDSLGNHLSSVSGNPRETLFLYHRISVLIHISNLVAF